MVIFYNLIVRVLLLKDIIYLNYVDYWVILEVLVSLVRFNSFGWCYVIIWE